MAENGGMCPVFEQQALPAVSNAPCLPLVAVDAIPRAAVDGDQALVEVVQKRRAERIISEVVDVTPCKYPVKRCHEATEGEPQSHHRQIAEVPGEPCAAATCVQDRDDGRHARSS